MMMILKGLSRLENPMGCCREIILITIFKKINFSLDRQLPRLYLSSKHIMIDCVSDDELVARFGSKLKIDIKIKLIILIKNASLTMNSLPGSV